MACWSSQCVDCAPPPPHCPPPPPAQGALSANRALIRQAAAAARATHRRKAVPPLARRSLPVALPYVAPIPTSSSWTYIRSNFRGEDRPELTHIPYFGDEVNDADMLRDVYTIKYVCEVRWG
jgi:hypothetical protein